MLIFRHLLLTNNSYDKPLDIKREVVMHLVLLMLQARVELISQMNNSLIHTVFYVFCRLFDLI